MAQRLTGAMEDYLARDMSRFHMPGHKGAPLPVLGDISRLDVTEVEGLDSLCHASGPIRKTELAYSGLYGTVGSFISAGGSTLCIQAMLALALRPGDTVLAGRGAHTAALNAMALLDINPVWVVPPVCAESGLALAVSPNQIEEMLALHGDVKAVCLTSPNYFGVICDISRISDLCGRYKVPLLVDNAHGAHLAFLPDSLHPISLGADICCDSLHKTLPVLTGGAMLHIGNPDYLPRAREMLALFGSTSPSYPIMLSIDSALDYLRGEMRAGLLRVAERISGLAVLAKSRGFLLPDAPLLDPMRLTLGAAKLGYKGAELGAYFRKSQIEPEYAGTTFCVLMASPFNSPRDFERLEQAISALPARAPLPVIPFDFTLPRREVSLREAVFAPTQTVATEDASGRIAGATAAPCPPGIALVSAGELIDAETAALLKKYGILQVNVLR